MMRALLGGFASAVFALLLFVTGPMSARAADSTTRTDWERGLASLEVRYPSVGVNATAIELESLAAELGIELAPLKLDRVHPGVNARARYLEIRAGDFVRSQTESAGDAIDGPPAPLAAFLTTRAEKIGNIVEALSRGEPPRWELDVRRGGGVEWVNWLGHIGLQRLLIANALVLARDGCVPDALRCLDASWRLNEALVGRPEMLAQMIAINVARMQAGALRKLLPTSPTWIQRMKFEDLRTSFLASIRSDVWTAFVGQRPGEAELPELLKFADGMNRLSKALEKQNGCSFTPAVAEGIWKPLFAGGASAILGEIAVPNLLETVHRFFSLRLEGEMTAKILGARAFRRNSHDGAWRSGLSTESSVCLGASWGYEVDNDGSVTLSFTGPQEEWPSGGGLRVPLRFTDAGRR